MEENTKTTAKKTYNYYLLAFAILSVLDMVFLWIIGPIAVSMLINNKDLQWVPLSFIIADSILLIILGLLALSSSKKK